jgi:hypothetical protein
MGRVAAADSISNRHPTGAEYGNAGNGRDDDPLSLGRLAMAAALRLTGPAVPTSHATIMPCGWRRAVRDGPISG